MSKEPVQEPCPECGSVGDHEDWCQDSIDTETVEENRGHDANQGEPGIAG